MLDLSERASLYKTLINEIEDKDLKREFSSRLKTFLEDEGVAEYVTYRAEQEMNKGSGSQDMRTLESHILKNLARDFIP